MKTFVLKEPLISHLKYCYYKNSRNIKFDHEMLSAMSRSFTIMGGIKARDQYKPLIFSHPVPREASYKKVNAQENQNSRCSKLCLGTSLHKESQWKKNATLTFSMDLTTKWSLNDRKISPNFWEWGLF